MVVALLSVLTVLMMAAVVLLTQLWMRARQGDPRMGTQLLQLKEGSERALRDEMLRGREESARAAMATREEMGRAMRQLTDSVVGRIQDARTEHADSARELRGELNGALKLFGDSVMARVTEIAQLQHGQLDALAQAHERKLEGMRALVEEKLGGLQKDNQQKLEAIRATVDEKLHATLETRLGESFRVVSERLETVHRGLGEMQSLAAGVGDLKKVLTNVKLRGTWGEMQLGALLEQMFTPEQYARNIPTRLGSQERVEFALKLPGREPGEAVWLPLDAKFPQEDYQRLQEALERGDVDAAEAAGKALEVRVKAEARSIKLKYLDPPHTTEFAVMFIPLEALYAEILRRPGVLDVLQREHRVLLTGPSTMGALLSSLQMGFSILAIEKRSGEVWNTLRSVKKDFARFGELLDRAQQKLGEASRTIESAARASRGIESDLRHVEEMPAQPQLRLLDTEEPPMGGTGSSGA